MQYASIVARANIPSSPQAALPESEVAMYLFQVKNELPVAKGCYHHCFPHRHSQALPT